MTKTKVKKQARARRGHGGPVRKESRALQTRAPRRPPWGTLSEVLQGRYPKAAPAEIKFFFLTAQRLGLDPLTNQIHLIPRYDDEAGSWRSTIQVGIDGFRSISARSGKYAGSDEAVFDEGLSQYEMTKAGRKYPTTATVQVYITVNGDRVAVAASAVWDSYYPGEKKGFMWRKFPYLMLAKCAEAQALRRACPNLLSGVYAPEEAGLSELDAKPEAKPEPKKVTAKAEPAVKQLAGPVQNGTAKPVAAKPEAAGECVWKDGGKANAWLHAEANRLGLNVDLLHDFLHGRLKKPSLKLVPEGELAKWAETMHAITPNSAEHGRVMDQLSKYAPAAAGVAR